MHLGESIVFQKRLGKASFLHAMVYIPSFIIGIPGILIPEDKYIYITYKSMNVHCQRVVNVWKNRGDPKDSRLEERVFSMLSFMKGLITLIHTWGFPKMLVLNNHVSY